ncbi:SOS response-associated peptidase family protein [Phycisphaerales bacterium AB-hyl4]|uniref:SOS response-associated peptidase family protein n=1 Tax=Natronomicrosphaera hydrolytica TaxID=3242702 RepID=A0ABV4U8X2_9BACT
MVMCGRYTLHTSPQRIAELFEAQLTVGLADVVPRYNIAPTLTCT